MKMNIYRIYLKIKEGSINSCFSTSSCITKTTRLVINSFMVFYMFHLLRAYLVEASPFSAESEEAENGEV